MLKSVIPGQAVKNLTVNDTLDGGAVLPGFTPALKEVADRSDDDTLDQ